MPASLLQRTVPPLVSLASGALVVLLATGAVPARPGGDGFASGHESDGGFEYALIRPGGGSTVITGQFDDGERLGRLQTQDESGGRELLWFSIEGREYVIRDAARVARARNVLEPMRSLGEQQGRLGERQGALGRRQGRLGRLEGELAMMEARLALPADGLDDSARSQREDLREQLRSLREQLRQLRDDTRGLEAQQEALARQQSELGRRQTAAWRRASVEMRALANESVIDGTAKPLGE